MKNLFFILISVFMLCSLELSAQTDTQDTKAGRLIRQAVKRKYIEYVRTDESTADRFFSDFKANQKKIKAMLKERKSLMSEIEVNTDANDMSTKLDKLSQIDSQIFNQRKDFIDSLNSYLTPNQIAKTIIFEKKIIKLIKNTKH